MKLIRIIVATLIAAVVVLLGAQAASAHATLVSSTPSNAEVLATAPTKVSLKFSESVSLGAGYLRVVDDSGKRVDTGNVAVDGATVSVPLAGDLPDGGYIISYRLVSDDSHPVAGGVTFAVGDAAPPSIDSQGTQIGGASEDPAIAALYPLVRWLGYLGLAFVAGVVVLTLLDPVLRTARGTSTLAWLGFDIALGATVLGGLLQGPYAAGRGLGSIFDGSLMSATLETGIGQMSALRLLILGVVGVLLWEWFIATSERRALTWTIGGGVLAAAVTHAASGHAVADGISWLSIPTTSMHLGAVAAWIGGLVVLLMVAIGRRTPLDDDGQRAVASRFSRLAPILVAVIVVSGVTEAFVRVGSWDALFATTYGRLLIGKTALLVLALAAAYGSRRLVMARRSKGDLVRLRRTVLTEAAAGAAAIALAAALVATPPAREAYVVAQDTNISFDNGYLAQVSLDPARTGPNTLHLYLFDRNNTLASAVDDVEVTVANEAAKLGPIDVDAQNVGTGHFIATDVQLPARGTWTITITFTETGFGAVSAGGTIDVN